MIAVKSPNTLYPSLVLKGEFPDAFFDILEGISHRTFKNDTGIYTTFPFWHIESLARFSPPQNDLAKKLREQFAKQAEAIEQIKAGHHPLIDAAPRYFYSHQKIAWALGMVCKTFGFFLEQGTGKTAVGIEIMRSRRTPTLIICPVTLIRGTWLPELRLRAPELSVANLHESRDMVDYDFDVYLINKEKLSRSANEFAVPLRPKIGRVIIDESSMLKNPNAKITKACIDLFGTIPERYCLSGTPAPNGPHEFWGQATFLRPGLLPISYLEYMKAWFTQVYKDSYRIRQGCMETIMDRLSSCSIFMAKADCVDLPEKNFIPRYVALDEKVRRAYTQMKTMLMQQVFQIEGSGKRAGSMLAQIMKLREITSGFIVQGKEENAKWHLISKHKFEALEEILEECGNEQVVIWMNFIEDFHQFYKLFPHLQSYPAGHPYAGLPRSGYIYGDISSQKDRADTIDAFNAGKLQYILANPRSLGHGVTLIKQPQKPCAKVIYFDLDYSLESFEQSQDRVHRIGQTRSVDYYAILAEDTIDIAIWERLKSKKDTMSEALEFLK